MTYLVRIPLQPLMWPSLCACCLKHLPEKPTLAVPSKPLATVQYCHGCVMHQKRQAGFDTMVYACLAGVGMGLMLGKMWLSVFGGLMCYAWLRSSGPGHLAKGYCTASRPAVRVRSRGQTRITLEFANKAYLDAFLDLNHPGLRKSIGFLAV